MTKAYAVIKAQTRISTAANFEPDKINAMTQPFRINLTEPLHPPIPPSSQQSLQYFDNLLYLPSFLSV